MLSNDMQEKIAIFETQENDQYLVVKEKDDQIREKTQELEAYISKTEQRALEREKELQSV